jgi:TolB-like protein/Flp pilus assembly protein TadD
VLLNEFLNELKRRNVYRAAVAYAGVGWVVIETADLVFPRMNLPDWTVNLVLLLVALGFPIFVVCAWLFDVNDQGLVLTRPSRAVERSGPSLRTLAEFALILLLVCAVGYLYLERLALGDQFTQAERAEQAQAEAGQSTVTGPQQYRAMAVLPFVDLSQARDQSWFAEGIAEELLHALASVDGLHVVARTSSFAFKGTGKTVSEIAEVLGVQAVLEGSVRRSQDRVKISAQLIDASSGYNVWSGSYERQLTNIFQLQDELAKSVVRAMQIELGVKAGTRLVADQTSNPEAYAWFMRGRALVTWANPAAGVRSLRFFEKAVELEPGYALAWGYLAMVRALNAFWDPINQKTSTEAIHAYEMALSIDPLQSEALAAKAWLTLLLENDWHKAGRLYQQAMQTGENTAAATGFAAFLLMPIGSFVEANALYALAEQRDPLQAGYKAGLANFLLWSGDYEAAIQKAGEALAMNPQHVFAITAVLAGYTRTGRFAEARALLETIPAELRALPNIKARTGLYYAASGEPDKASTLLREIVESPVAMPFLTVCELALALGEVEQAVDIMERMVEHNYWPYIWIRARFHSNPLINTNPRYLALLERIGLDDDSVIELRRTLSLGNGPRIVDVSGGSDQPAAAP